MNMFGALTRVSADWPYLVIGLVLIVVAGAIYAVWQDWREARAERAIRQDRLKRIQAMDDWHQRRRGQKGSNDAA